MPKDCARCGAENVIQAAECAECGRSFGRQPQPREPKERGNPLVGCLTFLLGVALLVWAASKLMYG